MQDLLHRLYRLTLSQKKLRTEDFVSLCLGRHLEQDGPLLDALIDRLAAQLTPEQADPLKGWRACADRGVEVRAQVLARTTNEARPGWADLVLGLRGQDEPARVVIEAKVGGSFPKDEQLARYRQAFSDAIVVPLVERRAAVGHPTPFLTWDDVLHALATTTAPAHCTSAREDLQKLMLAAEVGDPRLALPSGAYDKALDFENNFNRLDDRIQKCLVQMGPNPTVRNTMRKRLKKARYEHEPADGWGSGFSQSKAIPGTRIKGLALAVRASSFADELVWQLEVRVAGKKLPGWMNSPDSEWRRVPGTTRWFVTELGRPRGTGALNIENFRELIVAGKAALRRLHLQTEGGDWHAKGKGKAPRGPRLPIPELREGLLAWEPVREAVDRTITDAIAGVVAAHGDKDRGSGFRAYDDGWRTFEGVLPDDILLYGERHQGLEAIDFTLTNPPADAPERFAAALQAWPADLQKPAPVDETTIRLPLDGATFCHTALVPSLVALLSAVIAPA